LDNRHGQAKRPITILCNRVCFMKTQVKWIGGMVSVCPRYLVAGSGVAAQTPPRTATFLPLILVVLSGFSTMAVADTPGRNCRSRPSRSDRSRPDASGHSHDPQHGFKGLGSYPPRKRVQPVSEGYATVGMPGRGPASGHRSEKDRREARRYDSGELSLLGARPGSLREPLGPFNGSCRQGASLFRDASIG
jgi:hypothetical protein